MTVSIDDNAVYIPAINFTEVVADPAAPSSGHALLYIKDGVWYARRSTGSPTALGGSVALAENLLAVGDGDGLLSALSAGAEGAVPTRQADGTLAEVVPDIVSPGGGVGLANVMPWTHSSYNGTAPTLTATTGQWASIQLQNTTPLSTDWVEWTVWLPAGTFTVSLFIYRTTSGGQFDCILDGTTLGSVEFYNGTNQANQAVSFTGATIAAEGAKALRLSCTGKHASSNSYRYFLSMITLSRTA